MPILRAGTALNLNTVPFSLARMMSVPDATLVKHVAQSTTDKFNPSQDLYPASLLCSSRLKCLNIFDLQDQLSQLCHELNSAAQYPCQQGRRVNLRLWSTTTTKCMGLRCGRTSPVLPHSCRNEHRSLWGVKRDAERQCLTLQLWGPGSDETMEDSCSVVSPA